MGALRVVRDREGLAAYLAGGEVTADIARLLGRWAEPGRPAVLVVLDWDPPFAAVYPEGELIDAFPEATVIPALPVGDLGPGRLLVVVIDKEGNTAYIVPDPRAEN